jgi:hypothetical protein
MADIRVGNLRVRDNHLLCDVVNETVRASLRKSQNSSWAEEQGCEWSQREVRSEMVDWLQVEAQCSAEREPLFLC